MALTAASIRQIFPEFGDSTAYPDARITFALNEASLRLLPSVWGELLDTGTAYFVAHRLAVSSPIRAVINGSGGGQAQTVAALAPAPGIITSKAVGSVSKSIDVTMGSVDGAGEFNVTQYGREFAGLAASVAVGAMQF